MGVPVRYAGPAVTLLLLLATGFILWRVKPILPVSRVKPFLAVVLSSAILTGYPMFLYGFNWVSYCNDDMANYCMSGKFFLNHGFFDVLNWQDIITNRDASLVYWFLEVFSGMRAGSEELIAWTASLTGLTTHQIFMPTILALQLVLTTAAGAIVLRNRTRRRAALLVTFWTAFSALVALGTMYQLIAQVFGLSLLAGFTALFLNPYRREPRRLLARTSLLRAILAAAMCVVYPEVLPFAGLSFLLYHALLLVHRRESLGALARSLGPILGGILLLTSVFLPGVVSTVMVQAASVHGIRGSVSLFPYYLMPSGFAYLWGFSYIGGSVGAVSLNAFILLGMLLTAACLAGTLAIAWRGEAAAVMTLIMAALALRLFLGRMDFGLFKIAMYVQPFLIASAVLSWNAFIGKRVARFGRRTRIALGLGPMVLVAALGMRAEFFYVARSTGKTGSGFIEIPNASESGLVSELEGLSRSPRRSIILTDSPNVVLMKFESLYFAGSSFCAPAFDYMDSILGARPVGACQRFLHLIKPSLESEAVSAVMRRQDVIKHRQFEMHGVVPLDNRFDIQGNADGVASQEFTLLASGPRQGIVNRSRSLREGGGDDVRLVPSEHARNYLIFVSSRLGTGYYSSEGRAQGLVAMYQLESDYYRPGGTMSAIGRDMLFQVLRPSKEMRVVLEYTATLNGDGRNQIPPVSVIGNECVRVGAVGRGSARLFSPPIVPQVVEKGQYVLLDMGVRGSMFPDGRWGLMRLYGMDLPNDPRRIAGFARDVSAISDEDYRALQAPQQLRNFPADLSNRDLEYSGIYEDGWVGESILAVLDQPRDCPMLAVSFAVPAISGTGASSVARVVLDGEEIAKRTYVPGKVQIDIPVPAVSGKHRVEIQFDRAVRLPSPDNRPASAQLLFVGFNGTAATAPPASGHR